MDYLVGGGAPAAGVHPNGQPHGDPDKIAATAAATGADPSHAAAMLEPHQYTHDEFVAATRNMPWGVAEKLWGMQHYLNPVQQLLPQHVQSLQNDITQASKEYEEATVPAVKAEALKQLNGRRDVLNKLIQNLILPQGLPYNQ